MDNSPTDDPTPEPAGTRQAIEHLRSSLEKGGDWPTALVEAVGLWTAPSETYEGREYTYFLDGEAFDWLVLAERLCQAAQDLVPDGATENLLFTGRLPDPFDEGQFKSLIGVDKARGYLNYFYGVTVEEALQLAVEHEIHRRNLSNGNRYQDDFSEEAFSRIYRAPRDKLLETFRQGRGYPSSDSMTLTESKEFTYWLFKYRLQRSDKARTASDTRKGLQQLHLMEAEARQTNRISP